MVNLQVSDNSNIFESDKIEDDVSSRAGATYI